MNSYSGLLPGRYPAIVDSVDQAKRLCRIRIPGLTDHADHLPLAEMEYPIGEKSRHKDYATEIEILPGDTVWIAFIGGDSRYPIITGARNPQSGNAINWRRWHHSNIQLLADNQLCLQAGNELVITSSKVTVKASSQVSIECADTLFSGNVTIQGHLAVDGSRLTHGGTNIGKAHKHGGVQGGPGTTTPPM